MGQQESNNQIDCFLEDVVEQIQYKPIRDDIKEELSAHIEDRKADYVERGMDESKAWSKAIENMGDAVEIGTNINKVHRVQENKPAMILILALVAIGILGNIRVIITDSGAWYSGFLHFLFGIIIFTFVYKLEYSKLVKNISKHFTMIVGIWGLYLAFYFIQIQFGSILFFNPIRITIIFAAQLLSIPTIIGIAYFNRRKEYQPFIIVTLFIAVTIGITTHLIFDDYMLAANLILIITVYITLIYMVAAGMMQGKNVKQVFLLLSSLGITVAVFGLSFSGKWKNVFEECFYPEKVAQDYFDDTYNSVLIRDLLGRAELVGRIELSQDELKRYITSEWYFDNLDDFSYKYKMQSVEQGSVSFEDVLPIYYHNNYRIAYWILKYGWLPSIILLSFVLATYVVLIQMVGKIKNKLGKVLAFSCTLAIILQFVLYVLGNMGYQFGSFCNLPFISEGIYSITTNMILAGLTCSAFRYDRVVKEEQKNDLCCKRQNM